MRKTYKKRWIRTALGVLLLGGGIIISNDILTTGIYIVIHYGKFVVYLLFIYRFVMSIIKIFNLRKYISYDEDFSLTKRGSGILIAGWVLIIGGITLMCIYNKKIKVLEHDASSYISNHIELRKGKMPVIHIGEVK